MTEPADHWTYDAPTGVWVNEGLSLRLLRRAAEGRWPEMRTPSVHEGKHVHEYGMAVDFTDPHAEAFLVEVLAATLRVVDWWVLLPHLRRGSETVCSCGDVLLDGDFGREIARHRLQHPEHTQEVHPGRFVALYGIGHEATR